MQKRKFFTSLVVWIYIFNLVIADDAYDCSRFSEFIIDSTRASAISSLIDNAKNLLEDAKKLATVKISYPTNKPKVEKPVGSAEIQEIDAHAIKKLKPMDCAHIQEINPNAKSGVHRIWPRSRVTEGPIDVYCDLTDDGGAWTVIQKRGDFNSSKDYFYKDWEMYKFGFGDRRKDHWIGNDCIFALTNQRLNIVKFTLADWEGNHTFAIYDEFWIEDESRHYMMHVSGYRGTAGDSFSDTNEELFTTKDKDNDKDVNNCAVQYKGAWWYKKCHSSNLNGMYLKGAHESFADGVEWNSFRGYTYSLRDSVIKIRPKYLRNISDVSPL